MRGPCGLVPELSVRDWRRSLGFYVGVLGFEVLYDRPGEGFAYLRLGRADLMVDQLGVGRDFDVPGGASLEWHFGRGLNLQIEVPALEPILERLRAEGAEPMVGPEERWYRRGATEMGQRQVVVADPDGFLLRLWEGLGVRSRAD